MDSDRGVRGRVPIKAEAAFADLDEGEATATKDATDFPDRLADPEFG